MLRKSVLLILVLSLSIFVVPAATAQDAEGGIVCDDATIILLLVAETAGYSQSENTLFPPVDLTQFDLGENQPFFDLVLGSMDEEEVEPLTDEIIGTELVPVIQEVSATAAELTQTEVKDIVDEAPECRELRESVINYVAASLVYEAVSEEE